VAGIDILIPTYCRPAALAVTLATLVGQTSRDFDVIVSDQTDDAASLQAGEVQAVIRVLEARGHRVDAAGHLPRRGLAEHRQHLLDRSRAPWVLFLDDDLILEPTVVERLALTLQEQGCGFVGMAPIGLSYAADVRPDQHQIEPWLGPVLPEVVRPGLPAWERYRLHNAANPLHVQRDLGRAETDRYRYHVAWVGGCVMYDAAKLRQVGGFGFWHALPAEHCGEDVLAQQLVARRFGGCGLLPSGVFHQELETTVPDRRINAPEALASLLDD
jgi:GT2 family glycosyltransferase